MADERVNQQRTNERRKNCIDHGFQKDAISEIQTNIGTIAKAVDVQTGQWTMLKIGIASIVAFCILIGTTVLSTDRNITAYMAAHTSEAKDGFRRIGLSENLIEQNQYIIVQNQKLLNNHELRLLVLERLEDKNNGREKAEIFKKGME